MATVKTWTWPTTSRPLGFEVAAISTRVHSLRPAEKLFEEWRSQQDRPTLMKSLRTELEPQTEPRLRGGPLVQDLRAHVRHARLASVVPTSPARGARPHACRSCGAEHVCPRLRAAVYRALVSCTKDLSCGRAGRLPALGRCRHWSTLGHILGSRVVATVALGRLVAASWGRWRPRRRRGSPGSVAPAGSCVLPAAPALVPDVRPDHVLACAAGTVGFRAAPPFGPHPNTTLICRAGMQVGVRSPCPPHCPRRPRAPAVSFRHDAERPNRVIVRNRCVLRRCGDFAAIGLGCLGRKVRIRRPLRAPVCQSPRTRGRALNQLGGASLCLPGAGPGGARTAGGGARSLEALRRLA